MTTLLLQSFLETIFMVGVSALIAIVIGIPLAVFLNMTNPKGLCPRPFLHHTLNVVVNGTRSIPYIILVVLLMPITRMIVGTSIGTSAAIIPLSLAGALLITRMVEDSLRAVSADLLEVGLAMGASKRQIVFKILLAEAMPSIISNITTVLITLIGFSAMAGTVGGGGLGDLAIRYGYQRYDLPLMLLIVAILVGLVQMIQMIGDRLSRRLIK